MARLKNALRQHYIAPWKDGDKEAPSTGWLKIAKYISSVSDDTDEETDDTGYYDGDGTKEKTVISVTGAYSYEGSFDPEDPAQAFIAELKYKIDYERKVWQKVVSSDGKKEWVGVATVSAIIAGAGDATDYENFSCTITYNQIPKENTITTP